MQQECEICGDPTDATVCRNETASMARHLRQVVLVDGEVETSIARLARHGERGGRAGIAPDADPELDDSSRRRLPVMVHGWVARLDKPRYGALIETRLPFHDGMRARADRGINTITTSARHVCEERGIGVPRPGPVIGPLCRSGWGCNHPTCDWIRARTIDHPAARAATFLLTQLDWIRHRPEAAEIIDEVSAAAATLVRCVDVPPTLRYAGPCWNELPDGLCEFEIYALDGAATVRCGGCGVTHDVGLRQQWLLGQTTDALANAATIAVALTSLDHPVTSSMIRNYAARGRIVAHGTDRDGRPTYRVGDVLDVLAATEAARRASEQATRAKRTAPKVAEDERLSA